MTTNVDRTKATGREQILFLCAGYELKASLIGAIGAGAEVKICVAPKSLKDSGLIFDISGKGFADTKTLSYVDKALQSKTIVMNLELSYGPTLSASTSTPQEHSHRLFTEDNLQVGPIGLTSSDGGPPSVKIVSPGGFGYSKSIKNRTAITGRVIENEAFLWYLDALNAIQEQMPDDANRLP
jgi:hypothetical protein